MVKVVHFIVHMLEAPLLIRGRPVSRAARAQDRLEMEEEQTGARSPLITFSHFLPYQVLTGFYSHLVTYAACVPDQGARVWHEGA